MLGRSTEGHQLLTMHCTEKKMSILYSQCLKFTGEKSA